MTSVLCQAASTTTPRSRCVESFRQSACHAQVAVRSVHHGSNCGLAKCGRVELNGIPGTQGGDG
jgi:hypothetical protein